LLYQLSYFGLDLILSNAALRIFAFPTAVAGVPGNLLSP